MLEGQSKRKLVYKLRQQKLLLPEVIILSLSTLDRRVKESSEAHHKGLNTIFARIVHHIYLLAKDLARLLYVQ